MDPTKPLDAKDSELITSRVFQLETLADTEALGGLLARNAQQGDVFLLRGELGAGKTAFARGRTFFEYYF